MVDIPCLPDPSILGQPDLKYHKIERTGSDNYWAIQWLVENLIYTTSKVNKEKGGFQRKAMTFCELTNFKQFEGFRKSHVENMVVFFP